MKIESMFALFSVYLMIAFFASFIFYLVVDEEPKPDVRDSEDDTVVEEGLKQWGGK